MTGKCIRTVTPCISVGSAVITSQAYIANTTTSSFSSVCSSDVSDSCFRAIQNKTETRSLSFTTRTTEAYNTTFNTDQHFAALGCCCNRPPAPTSSITKCSLSSHLQAGSFCRPRTIAYVQRATYQMLGQKLL